jgi:ATP-binding cassette subfamily B protein
MNHDNGTSALPEKLLPFILRYLKNKKWQLAGYTVVSLIWAVEFSLSPYLLKVIIDTVIKFPADQTGLLAAISVPVVLYISMPMMLNFGFRLYQYINLHFYPEIKAAIAKDIFAYLLHHSHAFFQNTFTGSLTKKISDLVNVESLITIAIEWFYLRFFPILIASITLFKVVHPIFGIVLFFYAFLFIYFSFLASRKSEGLARQYSESGAKMNGTIADSITNIMSTKLFANIPDEIANVEKDINEVVKHDKAMQWYNVKISFLQGTGVTLLTAFMLSALLYGRIHGWVSTGDFALVLSLSISFIGIVYGIGQQMQSFSKSMGICNQALSIIRVPHEIKDQPDALPLHVTMGQIKFENVEFQYPENKLLFTNLNLAIKGGEKVGLVGYSGGGKSTFIKLILRLIDTHSGHIFIDNQDIKKVKKSSLRKQIGTIPQESDLFHRTVMENIRFARMDASDEEVIEAAKKARCHEFICELPEQYQSLVGERGVKLSGGQKQRIAIARAFLKNAPILILDEATSSLDSITENDIKESLHAVMAGKTTIVIAHRLSTLKDMDRILVFVEGKVIEDGSLNVLLNNTDSHFYKLWQMQAEGFIPSIPTK